MEVKLNHTVERIDYSDDSKEIIVTTKKGPFTADLVVVTLPLGILKKRYVVELFPFFVIFFFNS